MPALQRQRIAILGAGPGAISAAYWLTSSPALRERFEVKVYSEGWRIGGKCASGRAWPTQQIHEHGLHVFMGSYEHAFATIRRCFAEWRTGSTRPWANWRDAFVCEEDVMLMQRVPSVLDRSGVGWAPWPVHLPAMPGQPGDDLLGWTPDQAEAPRTTAHDGAALWRNSLTLARAFLDEQSRAFPALATLPWARALDALDTLGDSAGDPGNAMAHLQNMGQAIESLLKKHLTALSAPPASANETWWQSLLKDLDEVILALIKILALLNLGVAAALGCVADGLCCDPSAWDRLNELDLRQWLKQHGALDFALACAPIQALYDLTFAYRGGDASQIDNGSLAAGVTLRFILSLVVGRRGAPLWKAQASIADTVFVPFYQVLTDAPARADVKFFHRVTHLGLGPDPDQPTQIESIRLQRQAIPRGDYQPLIRVKGLDCWPDEPLWEQLQDGAKHQAEGARFEREGDQACTDTVELRVGRDFDLVILAVPPESIKHIGQALLSLPQWQDMLAHSASTATGAFQLWLKQSLPQLGWTGPTRTASAYAEPFSSFADMSQTLRYEGWDPVPSPVSVQYFCGCLPDGEGLQPPLGSLVNDWLAQYIPGLWPKAQLSACVVARYDRLNDHGWHRYVQTPAGSVKHRLSPGGSGIANLFLAGDWTLTTFSGGCFESAMESGMLAAQAICQPTSPTQA